MEGSSNIVDTTLAVANVSSRRVWKPVYPYTLKGEINFEGPVYSRLIGQDGPQEDRLLYEHRANLREPGIAAFLARKSSGVGELGTISALTPERNGKVVAFACEHGLNAKYFEEVNVTSSVTVDPGVFPPSAWDQGSLDVLRAGSDKVYGVERVSYSPLAGAAGHSAGGAVGSVPMLTTPVATGTAPQTPLVVGADGRRRIWETPDGVFVRQPAHVFRSQDTGTVVWRTPSARSLAVGTPAVVVAYTGRLDADYISDVYDCSLDTASILLNVLSSKYTPYVRSVSPVMAEAYDEETLRFRGTIVRAMSGGITLQPEDPTKVYAFQIRSRKIAGQGDLQEVTPSSLMERSAKGDVASYAMLVTCPWWVCSYCDIVLPALMDVREDEWPAKDSFSDLTNYLRRHSKLIARVDETSEERFELKRKVDSFVKKYGGEAIVWG